MLVFRFIVVWIFENRVILASEQRCALFQASFFVLCNVAPPFRTLFSLSERFFTPFPNLIFVREQFSLPFRTSVFVSFCLVQTIRRNTGEATNLFCLMQNNTLCATCKQYAPYLAGVFFVENIDYAEIQVELDGAVEERRTCLVDRAAVRHPRRLSHRQSVCNESGRGVAFLVRQAGQPGRTGKPEWTKQTGRRGGRAKQAKQIVIHPKMSFTNN